MALATPGGSMLQVNVIALTELTRLVLPQMVARKRGKVMLLASLAAFQPGPGMAVYYATKSYVLSFGRAIGHELRGTGVTITTLCPGPTTSEFAEVANMQGAAGPRIAPGHCAAGSGTQWSKKLDAQAVSRATKEYLATSMTRQIRLASTAKPSPPTRVECGRRAACPQQRSFSL